MLELILGTVNGMGDGAIFITNEDILDGSTPYCAIQLCIIWCRYRYEWKYFEGQNKHVIVECN